MKIFFLLKIILIYIVLSVNCYADNSDKKNSLIVLGSNNAKVKIKELTYDKKYLTACNFCNGRDYKTPAIDAAIQATKVLPYEKKI